MNVINNYTKVQSQGQKVQEKMASLPSVAATVALLCSSIPEEVTPSYWASQAHGNRCPINWSSEKVIFVKIEKESLGKVKKVAVDSRAFSDNRDILLQILSAIITLMQEFEDGKFIPEETKLTPKKIATSSQDNKMSIPSILQAEAKAHPVSGLNSYSLLEKISTAVFAAEAPKDDVKKVVTVADNSSLECILEMLSEKEIEDLINECGASSMSVLNSIRVAINAMKQSKGGNTTDSLALEGEEGDDTTKAAADSEPDPIDIGCPPRMNMPPGVPLSASNTDRLMILLRKMKECLDYLISKGTSLNTDFVQSALDKAQSSLGRIIGSDLDKATDDSSEAADSSEAEVLSIDQIIDYCNYAATYLWALAKLILHCNIHMTTMDPVVLQSFQNEVMSKFPRSLENSFFITEESHLDNKQYLTLHTVREDILFMLQANKSPKFDLAVTAFCHISKAQKNTVSIVGYDTFVEKENIQSAKNYLVWALEKLGIPMQVTSETATFHQTEFSMKLVTSYRIDRDNQWVIHTLYSFLDHMGQVYERSGYFGEIGIGLPIPVKEPDSKSVSNESKLTIAIKGLKSQPKSFAHTRSGPLVITAEEDAFILPSVPINLPIGQRRNLPESAENLFRFEKVCDGVKIKEHLKSLEKTRVQLSATAGTPTKGKGSKKDAKRAVKTNNTPILEDVIKKISLLRIGLCAAEIADLREQESIVSDRIAMINDLVTVYANGFPKLPTACIQDSNDIRSDIGKFLNELTLDIDVSAFYDEIVSRVQSIADAVLAAKEPTARIPTAEESTARIPTSEESTARTPTAEI